MKEWGVTVPEQSGIGQNSVLFSAKGGCPGQPGITDIFSVKNKDGSKEVLPDLSVFAETEMTYMAISARTAEVANTCVRTHRGWLQFADSHFFPDITTRAGPRLKYTGKVLVCEKKPYLLTVSLVYVFFLHFYAVILRLFVDFSFSLLDKIQPTYETLLPFQVF